MASGPTPLVGTRHTRISVPLPIPTNILLLCSSKAVTDMRALRQLFVDQLPLGLGQFKNQNPGTNFKTPFSCRSSPTTLSPPLHLPHSTSWNLSRPPPKVFFQEGGWPERPPPPQVPPRDHGQPGWRWLENYKIRFQQVDDWSAFLQQSF